MTAALRSPVSHRGINYVHKSTRQQHSRRGWRVKTIRVIDASQSMPVRKSLLKRSSIAFSLLYVTLFEEGGREGRERAIGYGSANGRWKEPRMQITLHTHTHTHTLVTVRGMRRSMGQKFV